MNELLNEPAVRLFAICYLVLVLKMMVVGSYTSVLRLRGRVYATPEDYTLQGLDPSTSANPDIERARRAHRNDLENILPFFGVGLFYALSRPAMLGAEIALIGFTVARVLHSVFYLRAMQPARTIAFAIGGLLMLWMLLAATWSLVAG